MKGLEKRKQNCEQLDALLNGESLKGDTLYKKVSTLGKPNTWRGVTLDKTMGLRLLEVLKTTSIERSR